ncbi:uncharacterized protein TNCV_2720061 [Trichonephila clavipes]|nr:uncharacterized protein TNCV_2720061 [Trichonephila clavipes]
MAYEVWRHKVPQSRQTFIPEEPMAMGTKTEISNADPCFLPIRNDCWCERGPLRGAKETVRWSEVILSMDELNLDQAPQDINKEEFQLERVRLQAFVAATDPGCKTELIRSSSLGLLKYIIEFELEDGLQNIVIMLSIF